MKELSEWILVLLIVVVFFLVNALLLMLLWNFVVPDIFNIKKITFEQSSALYALAYLLFKSFTYTKSNGK
jgi:hypothetical protein